MYTSNVGHICGVLIVMEDTREEEGAAGNYLPSDYKNSARQKMRKSMILATSVNHKTEINVLAALDKNILLRRKMEILFPIANKSTSQYAFSCNKTICMLEIILYLVLW